jgi:HK97 family phage major capsid protein
MSPDAWTALVTLKETAGSARPVLTSQAVGPTGQTQRSLLGVPVRVTNGVPAATAYVVDGGRCTAVVRRDGDVRADSSVRFTSDVTAVRATMRMGWAVPYPEAVVRIFDVP